MSGKIEVWAGDAAANDRLIQTEVIAILPRIFKKSVIDSYSLSFPPSSAPLATPAQSIQVTRSQIFGGQILPGRNPGDVLEFPSGHASNCYTTIAMHHGLAACAVNGFPSSYLIDSSIEKNLENELFEVVVDALENLVRRFKTFGRGRGGKGGEVARLSRVAI